MLAKLLLKQTPAAGHVLPACVPLVRRENDDGLSTYWSMRDYLLEKLLRILLIYVRT